MNIKVIFDKASKFLVKHGPEIMTGVGIVLSITATGLAIKETPKAVKALDDLKEENPDANILDKAKAIVPIYWPMAAAEVASVVCIATSTKVGLSRYAAILAAYEISEGKFKDLKDELPKMFGETKTKEIYDAVAKNKIRENHVGGSQVILTGKGNYLCYDCITGRYFRCTIEKIKEAVNEINFRLVNESIIGLNEFYYLIGLDEVKIGDDMGWNLRDMNDKLNVHFTYDGDINGEPTLIINYDIVPTKWYMD